MHLLHLDASALGAGSVTRTLGAAVVARWQAAVPGLRVDYRDLDADPLPHLTASVLGIPKSRLSRRITQLEADMGVRLLQRSTRRFAVTDVGNSVYRHAQSMLEEAQAAQEVVERLSAEPRGVVRVSVPVSLAQQQVPMLLPDFLALHPQVRVQLHVSNRRVDVINEGFDVAIRVRNKLDDDGSLVMRSFGMIQELLVASPKYLDGMGRPTDPSQLDGHVTMAMSEDEARQRWDLQGEDGRTVRVDLKPRVAGFDFPMLMALAKQGIGIGKSNPATRGFRSTRTVRPSSPCRSQRWRASSSPMDMVTWWSRSAGTAGRPMPSR